MGSKRSHEDSDSGSSTSSVPMAKRSRHIPLQDRCPWTHTAGAIAYLRNNEKYKEMSTVTGEAGAYNIFSRHLEDSETMILALAAENELLKQTVRRYHCYINNSDGAEDVGYKVCQVCDAYWFDEQLEPEFGAPPKRCKKCRRTHCTTCPCIVKTAA